MVSPLQTLRHAAWLARLVLVGVWLSLGVALAAPIARPAALELVCSSAGALRLVVSDEGGGSPAAGTPMDCPMCQSFAAPPPVVAGWLPPPAVRDGVWPPPPAGRVARRTQAPLPPRGPPGLLL